MDYDDPTDQTHFDDDVSMVPGRASSSTTANGPSDRELLSESNVPEQILLVEMIECFTSSMGAGPQACSVPSLVPERCANEAAGLENFSRVFRARYNATGPLVIARTLDEAIQESFNASIHEVPVCLHRTLRICTVVSRSAPRNVR